MDKKQLRNTLMLMACAFIWGTAFVAQSVGSDYMGPYTFLASRSWLACAFLLGLMAVLRKMGKTNPAAEPGFWQNKKVLLRGGIFCGVALFAASAAQQMGIGTTSTAKAGFMTALYVVLVPVAGVFLGSRPGVKLWCCVAASVVGLYLLCLAGRDTLSLTGGEWQLLVCAILFTARIMLVNHFSPQLDGIQLSFVQFFVVSVCPRSSRLSWRPRRPTSSAPRRSRLPIAASCPAAWPTRCRSSARRSWTRRLPVWRCVSRVCSAPWPVG